MAKHLAIDNLYKMADSGKMPFIEDSLLKRQFIRNSDWGIANKKQMHGEPQTRTKSQLPHAMLACYLST